MVSGYGIVTLSNAVYTCDGTYSCAIHGFLVTKTDEELSSEDQKFRSSEKWTLFIYSDRALMETGLPPSYIVPGCNVKGIAVGEMLSDRKEVTVAQPPRIVRG